MKNIFITLLCFLLLSVGVNAQNRIASRGDIGFSSVNDATNMADQIVKAAGLQSNFAIAEADVPNALAVLHQGKRFILYNPAFINLLTTATGTRWAAVSVLAHEIGHHLYRKNNNSRVALSSELEADEFSGYVLEKMGATLEEAQAAMNVLASTRATATHPAKYDRIKSIEKGWVNAGGIKRTVSPEIQNENEQRDIFPRSAIAATIVFDKSPGAAFYVTKRLNVVTVKNDEVSMIGKVAKLDDADYPYIIYDDGGYKLYVNREGTIVSPSGKKVGYMKAAE